MAQRVALPSPQSLFWYYEEERAARLAAHGKWWGRSTILNDFPMSVTIFLRSRKFFFPQPQNRFRWQKWTFQQNYNHFEKKFSKIDKKFVSQSILEVGGITFFKKVMFFQNLDILYRKSYSKFDGFWWLSLNLVVFLQIPRNMWSLQLQESIVRWIFYRFWKTFFQSGCNFAGKSISVI